MLNPNKGELGKVSKQKLENINSEIRSKTDINQSRKTGDVIDWFNQIHNKEKVHLNQYDIVEFYPNISEKLLREAITWARNFLNIPQEDEKIIITAKNTLLFHNSQPWKKKDTEGFFDNTMGSYDGAESCELVGLFILSQLKEIKQQNGLYRDDGLMASTLTRRQNENIKKKIVKLFKDMDLK